MRHLDKCCVLTWSCVMAGNVTPDNADNAETLPTIMITLWVGDMGDSHRCPLVSPPPIEASDGITGL